LMGEAVTNNVSSMVWLSGYEVKRISEIGYGCKKLWDCGNLGSRPSLKQIRDPQSHCSIVRDIDLWLVVEEAKEVVVPYRWAKTSALVVEVIVLWWRMIIYFLDDYFEHIPVIARNVGATLNGVVVSQIRHMKAERWCKTRLSSKGYVIMSPLWRDMNMTLDCFSSDAWVSQDRFNQSQWHSLSISKKKIKRKLIKR
jgi:hypothetical protein